MRKLFMAVAILGISATVSFAKAQCVNENGNKEPFAVEFGKLSSYLDLTPSQMDEVYDINEYFKGQHHIKLRLHSFIISQVNIRKCHSAS